MITFSQRYPKEIRRLEFVVQQIAKRQLGLSNQEVKNQGQPGIVILPDVLRRRLQSEVQFIVNHGYIEPFLTVHNQRKSMIYLHEASLRDLSVREVGYDLNEVIDASTLSFGSGSYNDVVFMDLLEILIVFSMNEKREDFTKRLNKIFNECDDLFVIYNGYICIRGQTGLRSIIPLLKDELLKTKLGRAIESEDFQITAQIAAGAIQYIFSSDTSKKKTQKEAESLVAEIASRVTVEEKTASFTSSLNDLIKISKNLNNTIQDIRHTDRHTVPVDGPNIYKLISNINLSILEAVILTLPEKYVIVSELDAIKQEYLNQYKIDKDKGWVVKKHVDPLLDLSLDDIPF